MINCEDFVARLSEWVDERLSDAQAEAMQRHADDCVHCAAEARLERRIVAAARELSTPPVPADLGQRTHRAVEAMALLERRKYGPNGPRPIAGNPILVQWVSMAAVLLITMLVGLMMGAHLRPGAPEVAEEPIDPPNKQVIHVKDAPGSSGDGYAYRRVKEQLARHVNSTQAVYDQAMKLDASAEPFARALIKTDMSLARLDRTTPALRVELKRRAPRLAVKAHGYLDHTERMVRLMDSWVTSKQSLDKLRHSLVQIRLKKQLESVRGLVALEAVPLPAVPPHGIAEAELPAFEAWTNARRHLHQGQVGLAILSARSLIEHHPRHPLSANARVFVQQLGKDGEVIFTWSSDEDESSKNHKKQRAMAVKQLRKLTGGFEVMLPPRVTMLTRDSLGIDGTTYQLRFASKTVPVFYEVWKTAEKLQQTKNGPMLQVTDSETTIAPIGAKLRHVREVTLEISPALWSAKLTATYAKLKASARITRAPVRPTRLTLTVGGNLFSRTKYPR